MSDGQFCQCAARCESECACDADWTPEEVYKLRTENAALQAKLSEQLTVPEGWLRAVDEEMVCCHLGVANPTDTYEEAKKKLAELIQWHVAVATDPTVNGGFMLAPVEPTPEMKAAGQTTIHHLANDGIRRHWQDVYGEGYKAMLAAAPTPKGAPRE